MVIVLRLEGLTNEAESEDIREFFHGLRIPQGAVHIIGGQIGEAFILFTSEKDGQLAIRRSGNLLKGSRVTLHISSVAELKQKLILSLKQEVTEITRDSPEIQPVNSPQQQACEKVETLNSSQQQDATGKLMVALLTAFKGMDSKTEDSNSNTLLNLQATQISHSPAFSPALPKTKSEKVSKGKLKSEASVCNPGYLRLNGLPHSVTKSEIRHFLHGLRVQEMLLNVRLGDRRGCLVKVASEEEVEIGLQRNGKSLTFTSSVEVKRATQNQWTHAMMKLKGSPEQIQTVTSTSEFHQKRKEKCITTRKRPYSRDQFPNACKGHAKCEEHYVMIRNLQPNMTKTDIKTLLGCPHLEKHKVQHLLDKNFMRTSTAFVAFDRVEDYVSAMNLSGSCFGKQVLDVSSITREKMLSQLSSNKKMMAQPKRQQSGFSKTCIYVRNLPADVSQVQVQDIFYQFHVAKEDITLLRDNKGNSLGEAVVSFGCEDTATHATCLDRSSFMGNEVLLTLITPQQLDSMLLEQSMNDSFQFTKNKKSTAVLEMYQTC